MTKVSLIGATGLVGKTVVKLLKNHPSLSLAKVYGSSKRMGQKFSEELDFLSLDDIERGEIVLSMLTSEAAGELEPIILQKGAKLISNASFHRKKEGTSLIVVDVNGEELFEKSPSCICIPNCNVAGITLALKPLSLNFGIEKMHVVTLQALSGAGYPGVPSLDSMANVIPFIEGEEEKIEEEPFRLLNRCQSSPFPISATSTRVPVVHGHMAVISVKLKRQATREEVIASWNTYVGLSQKMKLHFAAKRPIVYRDAPAFPEPRLEVEEDLGMRVSIGRLRECSLLDWKFVIVSHNLILGAAGSSVQIAELLTNTSCQNLIKDRAIHVSFPSLKRS